MRGAMKNWANLQPATTLPAGLGMRAGWVVSYVCAEPDAALPAGNCHKACERPFMPTTKRTHVNHTRWLPAHQQQGQAGRGPQSVQANKGTPV